MPLFKKKAEKKAAKKAKKEAEFLERLGREGK